MRKKRNPIIHKEDLSLSGAMSALADVATKDAIEKLTVDEINFHVAKELSLAHTFLWSFRSHFLLTMAYFSNNNPASRHLIKNLDYKDKNKVTKLYNSLNKINNMLTECGSTIRDEVEKLISADSDAQKKIEHIIELGDFKPFSLKKLLKNRSKGK